MPVSSNVSQAPAGMSPAGMAWAWAWVALLRSNTHRHGHGHGHRCRYERRQYEHHEVLSRMQDPQLIAQRKQQQQQQAEQAKTKVSDLLDPKSFKL